MGRRVAPIAVLLAVALGIAGSAAAQSSETGWPRRVSLPGASWAIEVDAAGFAVSVDITAPDGRNRYLMAEQRDGALALSVLIQPGPPGATPEQCREARNAGLRGTGLVREEIRTAEAGDTAELEYLIPVHQGVRVNHRNLWVFRARDGACVEVHVSKAGAGPGDAEALAALAGRTHLVQAPAAASPAPPRATSPPTVTLPPATSPPAAAPGTSPPSASTSAAAPEPAGPAARIFPVPGHGQLELTVPTDWRDTVDQPLGGLPPTIAFLPAEGEAFRLLVTALWDRDGRPISTDAVRAMAQRALNDARTYAVEQGAALVAAQGTEASGWYFRLTDRRVPAGTLPRGEYAYLVQGAARVGDLLLTFTLLTNARDGAEHEAAVALIRSARQLR